MAYNLFAGLAPTPPDVLLALIAAHEVDVRPEKIDIGVGVFRDTEGVTPIFQAIKRAEQRLVDEQMTKSYLGAEGDVAFVERMAALVFGTARAHSSLVVGLQTPGGTGALRLGAELVALAQPGARIWMGTPTWANHAPIFQAAGLTPVSHPYFDASSRMVDFGSMMEALRRAQRGDILLLHGCCHNPTGADLALGEWREIGDFCERAGVIPFVDLAYHGLGDGLDEDTAGLRALLDRVETALIAYSCDKNFGLYRDRVGALWVQTESEVAANLVRGNLGSLTRALWSMPPDHGAAAVRIILEDPALARDWRRELTSMRARLNGIRKALADHHAAFAMLVQQRGLFAKLALDARAVAALRVDHAIYMAPDGRINLAGLGEGRLERFIEAVLPYMQDAAPK